MNQDFLVMRQRLHDSMRTYMNYGSDRPDYVPPYTQAEIDACLAIVDNYAMALQALVAANAANESSILGEVKQAVLALNDLNDELGLIETVEREYLCGLIFIGAAAAGMAVTTDITEAWRDW